jgi:uncharacterized protein YegL
MAGGIQVFPFYILCDTSRSMRGDRIAAVNQGLPLLHQAIVSDPVVSEKIRLGVISFATEAQEDLPLSQLSHIASMPTLTAGGQTNYAKGFAKARELIDRDVEQLKSSGYSVLRPCVYFITDGRPGDGWKTVRDSWVDKTVNRYAPNIICFGVADADKEILGRVSTQYTFLADRGTSSTNALNEVMKSITSSVVSTARNNEAGIAIPAGGETFRVINHGEEK